MSDRGSRRRKGARRGSAAASQAAAEPVAAAPEATGGWWRRALGPRRPVTSPYPPLGLSLARGAVAGGSPAVLVVAFLGLLALWAAFALLDAALSGQGMVYVLGLPPVHVPLDVGVVQSLLRTSSTVALLSLLALGVGRALILGALALLVTDALRSASGPRASLRRLPRVAVSMFGIYGLEVGMFLFLLLFLSSILGPAAVLVMLVLGLHFLGFAPVVAAAEGVTAGAAVRIGFRAARLPGARHFTLVLLYIAAVLYGGAGATAAAGEAAPATPTILTWAVALLATFGHVVVLGALAFRWQEAREQVLAEDARRQQQRREARGGGRGRRAAPARKVSSRNPSSGRKSAGAAASTRSGEAPSGSTAGSKTAKGAQTAKASRSRKKRRR